MIRKALCARIFGAAAAVALVGSLAGCTATNQAGPTAAVQTSGEAAVHAYSTGSGPGGDDHDAFVGCMTENGVPAPPEGGPGGPPPGGGHRGGPQPGGTPPAGPPPAGAPAGPPPEGGANAGTPSAPPGVDREVWDTAMQACASLAPPPRS